MHTALLLLVLTTGYIASVCPFEDDYIEIDRSRYIEFPGGDGTLYPVDLEAEPDYDLLSKIERDPGNNQYLLFTIYNNSTAQNLYLDNVTSIINSHYNPFVQTIVVAHGWMSNQDHDINLWIRNAYLEENDVNVIILDWERLASADYATSVTGVPATGRRLGQFVRFLINTAGGNLNYFHFVGFSLGAHLVGNAGRELGGKVARITGLDPAGPLWHKNSNKLCPHDAVYVEAIHTSTKNISYGIRSALAVVDFFPNGGDSHQPGCVDNYCDHSRAWKLFAATVTYDHLIGAQCTCFYQLLTKKCCGTTLFMGNDDLNKYGFGIYHVETEMSYPF